MVAVSGFCHLYQFIMNYQEKLKHPKWQRKRLEILNRDDFTCCFCGDKETELHVHHLKYIGDPHEANNEDLETLCKHCHFIKTKFCEKDYGVFVSIIKMQEAILLVNDESTILLFDKQDDTIELVVSFVKNSIVFSELVNLSIKEWKNG